MAGRKVKGLYAVAGAIEAGSEDRGAVEAGPGEFGISATRPGRS